MDARSIDTAGWPLVYGRRDDVPGGPTVLLYGHYDVQPPDPLELWESLPFEPEIRNGRIYARGAGDNKGQHFANLLAIEAVLATEGRLPCNVVVLLEGEVLQAGHDDLVVQQDVEGRGIRRGVEDLQVGDGAPAGGEVTISGSGCPGSKVDYDVVADNAVHPIQPLGELPVGPFGAWSGTIAIPSMLTSGPARIRVRCLALTAFGEVSPVDYPTAVTLDVG